MASVLKSIGIKGLEAYLIDVEVSVYGGVAMTSIVGLGDTAVKEAAERMESCLVGLCSGGVRLFLQLGSRN